MGEKFIIYQMLPRIFGARDGRPGRFGDIDEAVLKELSKLNVSYIWYTGIIKHASPGEEGVKGHAGSPFAISDYYDVNSYLAENPENRMIEYEQLIKRTKAAGMETIMDFVPNHVARSYRSDRENLEDRNYYPGKIYDWDWSDTVKLDYSNADTREKMKNILLFWASKGVSGFRCDMVELVPVDFWEWCISAVKAQYPDVIFIGEAYQPENYPAYFDKGGFDYLYDKSGFYDCLKKIVRGEASASLLTGEWQKLGTNQPRMLNFLENHDEERITSPEFAGDGFKGFAALFVSLFFNKAPFMLYSGQEFGEGPEKTSIFDFVSLPKLKSWIDGINEGKPLKYLDYESKDIYKIYQAFCELAVNDEVLRVGETFDLQYVNPRSENYNPDRHFAFLRHYNEKTYLCAANFTDENVCLKINIPAEAFEYCSMEQTPELNSSRPVSIEIAQNSGSLLRIK